MRSFTRSRKAIKFITATTALLFASSVVSAADFSPELRDLIKKANAEGKFHSSWSQSSLGGTAGARRIEAGMNKMFGTKIKISFSPGRSMPGMSAKIRAEAAAGTPSTTDIFLGSSPYMLPLLKRKSCWIIPGPSCCRAASPV